MNNIIFSAILHITILAIMAVTTETSLANDDAEAIDKNGILFEDYFNRDELGDHYEIIDPDPNRLVLDEEKLLIVPTNPINNIVLLQKNISEDFIATANVRMQITLDNAFGFIYWLDNKNSISLGVAGTSGGDILPWDRREPWLSDRRQLFFTKTLDGKHNNIADKIYQLGERDLLGFSDRSEIWYLQLQRSGRKYTGRISADGVDWLTIGTHTVVPKYGRLGFNAFSMRIENVAEFDDFIIQSTND